jgi:hypothetical protein
MLTLMLALYGCSPTEDMRKSCEASIKGGLLNPETAEFFEFDEVSKEAFIRVSMANNQSASTPEQLKTSLARYWDEQIVGKGSKAFVFRYKADGRLGNKITQQALCLADGTSCVC